MKKQILFLVLSLIIVTPSFAGDVAAKPEESLQNAKVFQQDRKIVDEKTDKIKDMKPTKLQNLKEICANIEATASSLKKSVGDDVLRQQNTPSDCCLLYCVMKDFTDEYCAVSLTFSGLPQTCVDLCIAQEER